MSVSIDFIVEKAKEYLPDLDEGRVRRAYDLAVKAHAGQVRFSGEPYVTHPLEATKILLTLKPDEDTIIATLLHDVPADTGVLMKVIEKDFGSTVARLIQDTEKLSLVRIQKKQTQVESWRRMFLAMAKDMRVVFIKLSERLHNMRTLEYVAPEKQLRIAQETLQVYAPIASRLGIYTLKSQLEDLCFKFIYPKEYAELSVQFEAHGQMSQRYIEEAQRVLQNFLKKEGIEAEVSGRIKHMYSIYKKLRKKNTSRLEDVHDLFAIRIVLKDSLKEGHEFLGSCYTTLGAIHSYWMPMPGRFKDYIAVPKLNGYRSLHTTVMELLPGMSSQPVEIQIRTESMHREAEYGIASHWWYEDSRRASALLSRNEVEAILEERRLMAKIYTFLDKFPEERSKFEALLSNVEDSKKVELDHELIRLLEEASFSPLDIERLKTITARQPQTASTTFFQHQIDWLYGLEQLNDEVTDDVNLFEDRIFVLTPRGDVKDLPLGSTPVDFAYAVHTDVGNRCYQAKINGRIVGLDYELKSGDVVDILTRKEPQPNRYWLSFAKTSQAKSKVKAWFRLLDREKNIKAGRAMLNKLLKSLGKPLLGPHFQLLKNYGGKSLDLAHREHIVEQVGDGTITPNNVLRALFSEEDLLGNQVEKKLMHKPVVEAPLVNSDIKEGPNDVLITGQRDMPFTLSACCSPHYPQIIVGYVTRGRSIRIHQKSCRELVEINPERLLEASWFVAKDVPHYQVKLRIDSTDRVALLKDTINKVADLGISIVDFVLKERVGDRVVWDLVVEIMDFDLLEKLIYRLETIEGIVKVQKIQ